MPSRIGLFGGFAAFQKLRAIHVNEIPNGWLGDEADGNGVTVGTSPTDLVSVTVTVGTARKLKIYARGSIANGGSADGGIVNVKEGATDLGRVHRHPDAVAESFIAAWVTVNNPDAGGHTYRLVGDNTTGAFDLFGDAEIIVEDIGPAS